MKLLTKTSLLIITVSIFIFMTGNIAFFYTLKHMINKHVSNELHYKMYKIKEELKKNKIINENLTDLSDDISVKRIKNINISNNKPQVFDTVIYNKIQKKYIPYKSIKFIYSHNNKNYLVTIYKSTLSSSNLIEKITITSIIIIIIFLFMIYVLNRFIFVNVWSDFFKNLKTVREYDINGREKLNLKKSEIDEFDKLNKVLIQMVEKIQKDFINLKELTENTSHEIQTPLAIIKNNAELLLQSENLTEKNAELIYSIINTAERLSKLNKSLLMISKIENNQFEEKEIVNINHITKKIIENFKIIIEAEKLEIKYTPFNLFVKINPVLLDILIINLLKNAILHTEKTKQINITLTNCTFKISNTGHPLKIPEKDIFKRFKKGNFNREGTGLGLEIVKKICDYYNIKITYKYEEHQHIFSIDFTRLIPEKQQ